MVNTGDETATPREREKYVRLLRFQKIILYYGCYQKKINLRDFLDFSPMQKLKIKI